MPATSSVHSLYTMSQLESWTPTIASQSRWIIVCGWSRSCKLASNHVSQWCTLLHRSNEAQAPLVPGSKTTKLVSQTDHTVVANAGAAASHIVLSVWTLDNACLFVLCVFVISIVTSVMCSVYFSVTQRRENNSFNQITRITVLSKTWNHNNLHRCKKTNSWL